MKVSRLRRLKFMSASTNNNIGMLSLKCSRENIEHRWCKFQSAELILKLLKFKSLAEKFRVPVMASIEKIENPRERVDVASQWPARASCREFAQDISGKYLPRVIM